METNPTFKWLLIFTDGAHITAEGQEIADACQSVGRDKKNIAVSRAGFKRAIPIKRIDNAVTMPEETKAMLATLSRDRRALRNSGRAQIRTRPGGEAPQKKVNKALDKILEKN